MKTTIKTVLALMAGALAFSACSGEFATGENSNGSKTNKVAMTFTATQEDNSGASSRTEISDNNINWKSDDAITVWDGKEKNVFTTSSGGTTSATFTGTVTERSTSFTAVYPNSVGQNCTYNTDGTIAGVVIPATQTATEGTYDPAAAIMTATASGSTTSLAFKNVCSFLMITAAADYSKIVVTSTKNAPLAGTFTISNPGTTPTLTATSGTNVVTLSGTIESGKTYYIAVAPCSGAKQFAVDCYGTDGKIAKENVKYTETTFERSKWHSLGNTSGYPDFDSNLLPGCFSVSGDKSVHFTKGNLYCNASDEDNPVWSLASSQTQYETGTQTNDKIDHFYWSSNPSTAYSLEIYNDFVGFEDPSTDDEFFCGINNPLTIDDTEDLYALTSDENTYLLNTDNSETSYRQDALRFARATVNGVVGLLVFPDGYSSEVTIENSNTSDETATWEDNSFSSDDWTTLENAGVVFLPAAGWRGGSVLNGGGGSGCYWSATPDEFGKGFAYELGFGSNYVDPAGGGLRSYGNSVRLVK